MLSHQELCYLWLEITWKLLLLQNIAVQLYHAKNHARNLWVLLVNQMTSLHVLRGVFRMKKVFFFFSKNTHQDIWDK